MTFTVDYRDASGVRKQCVIEVADKSALWPILKAKGITAISVREGGVVPKAEKPPARPKRDQSGGRPIRWGRLVIFAVVAVVVVLCFLQVLSILMAKRVLRQITDRGPSVVEQSVTNEVSSVSNEAAVVKKEVDIFAVSNKVWISKNQYRTRLDDGSIITVIANDPEDEPKPIFTSSVNNFLVNYLEPGVAIPPTPVEFSDNDVLEAVMEQIVIEDDDDDDTVFAKKSVQLLQKEMKDYIKDGMTVQKFVRELQYRQEKEADMVAESRRMILEEIANDDIDMARELYVKLNEHLNAKGIPDMRLPKRYRSILMQKGEKK